MITEKYKKVGREYVLSDSTVNEYGFRLLTEGYQLESFQKNPIGYYMHRRDDGILLKWEDLRVEGDRIVGTPVINLANTRGTQTCDEAENGFLNAASVGHIVVLEYSTEPELMLPGQTGPTITKWYNKECSLVDIPGNGNALSCLYDAQENVLNLADMRTPDVLLAIEGKDALQAICQTLQLADNTDATTVTSAVQALATELRNLQSAQQQLLADKLQLHEELAALTAQRDKAEITGLLEQALEGRKITVELKNRLEKDYVGNATGLRTLLQAMPAYRTIAEQLSNQQQEAAEMQWGWDDYEQQDPSGRKLQSLKASNPVRYRELFDKKFTA